MRPCPSCHQEISEEYWKQGKCPQCQAVLNSESDASMQTVVDLSSSKDEEVNVGTETVVDEDLNSQLHSTAEADQSPEEQSIGSKTIIDDAPAQTVMLDEQGNSLGADEAGSATVYEEEAGQTILNPQTAQDSHSQSDEDAVAQTYVTDSGAAPFSADQTVVSEIPPDSPDSVQTILPEGGSLDPQIEKTWGMGLASATDPGMTIKGAEDDWQATDSHQTIPVRQLEEKSGQGTSGAEYQLVEVLGEGGMGIVWNALQSSVERNVAIKMIKTSIAKKQGQTEKFIAEAIVTGDLEHPNIVPIHEVGQDQVGNFFYAMKHVQGTPWNKVIEKKSLHENLDILLSVCDAIAFAHARGIIHRDLKPENIMLGGYGEVLVMDWGLALPTKEFTKRDLISSSHSMGGTPAYMAPEMATGPIEKISYTSDIYLLGAILYEIVTERRPHRGKTVQECLHGAIRNTITPTDRDGELVRIAIRAMQTRPEDRYPSVKEFQEAIRNYLEHEKSLALSRRASQELTEAVESSDYKKYAKSLFGFEEALALWPDNKNAKVGLADARQQYAQAALLKSDFDLAESLIDQNDSDQQELYQKIQNAIRDREQRQRMFRVARYTVAVLAVSILLVVGVSYYLVNIEMKRATAAEDVAVKAEGVAKTQQSLAEQRTVEVLEEKKKVEVQKEIAQTERDKAEDRKKEAEQQRVIAVVEKENAIQAREAEQYKSYIAKIGLAAAKVEENAFSDAQDLLLQCPPGLRNWEWGRLMYLCSQNSKEYLSTAPVDSLDFSPDGLHFATASWDGKVRIWNRDSGKEIRSLIHNNIYVHCVDWSPSGNLIASGSNDKQGNLKIWDAETGKLLASILAHSDAVLGVRFSDDQRWLLTCSYDNTARLWDVENPEKPKPGATLLGHTWWVWDAEFVPGFAPAQGDSTGDEKNQVVTVGQDGKAILWEITEQGTEAKPVVEFLEHEGPVYSVAYHPSGVQIATGGYDRQIMYWNPEEIVPFDFAAAINDEKREPQKFTTFSGHTGPVRAVSFSHDGQLLISGAQDNAVKIWQIDSGKSIKTFRGHDSTVRACEMTDDGRYLLSGAEDHRALLWSVNDYAEIQTLNGQELVGHNEAILSAYFSPSGNEVLTASRDRTARIWDVKTGQEKMLLKEGHQFLSSSAVFFQNEQLLATAAADSSVRIWNTTTGAELAHLLGTGRSASVAISSDDKLMVTGSNTNELMVWKTEDLVSQNDAAPIAVTKFSEHKNPVTAIAFVPGTSHLVSADTRGRCYLWDAQSGKMIWTARNHTLKVSDIRVINQGQTILTASIDRTIGVSSVKDGTENTSRVMPHDGPVVAFDVSSDETRLLSVVNLGDQEQSSQRIQSVVYAWDLEKTEIVRRIVLDGITTNDIAVSSDHRTAILACSDNTVKTVDLESEKVQILLDGNQHGGLLWSIHLSGNGRRLLSVGGIDARLWDVKTGKERMSFGPHGAVAATAMHPLGKTVVTGSWDHSLKFWDVQTGKSTGKISNANQAYINSVTYSHDGKMLVSAGDDGVAKLWDAQTRKELSQMTGHGGGIHIAVFSPDDQLILTASRDRTLRLWDVQTGKQIGKPLEGHQWAVLAADFSPDGKFIVSGSEDNLAILWDRKTGKKIAEMSGHTAAVTSVAYSADGMRILTASRDNTAKLWDATPGHFGNEILTLKRHQQEVTSVDFSVDRLNAVTGSRDGTAIIWPALDWKKLVE